MCHPHRRGSLERLCRYIARPALSNERLSVNERGQVVYRLKHPFRDGTTHVVLDPLDFMRHIRVPHPFGAASCCANRQSCRFGIARLAALVPRPRAHLTRYHGVFAPNFRHRNHIVPNTAHQGARNPHLPTPPMSWMQRLKRVFHIDIEHCPVCGGTLRVIACIEAPDLIERILDDGCTLQGIDLSGAHLTGTKMRNSNLRCAALNEVVMTDALLDDSCLKGVDFTGATLENADLSRTDLRDAILSNACLAGAKLKGSNLEDADFSGADFTGVNVAGVDFRGALNLTQRRMDQACGGPPAWPPAGAIAPSYRHCPEKPRCLSHQ